MMAPVERRAGLMVLYAFNLEIARAPWLTREAMIAEMRLQFWADMVAGARTADAAPAHDVATPLADLIRHGLPVEPLLAMINARRWSITHHALDDPSDDPRGDALSRFLDDTAGSVMWLGAHLLGAPPAAEGVVRDMAHASGLAALFLAVPALDAAAKSPFPNSPDSALQDMAQDGLLRLAKARDGRRLVPKSAAAALSAGVMARPVLGRAAKNPACIAAGTLAPPEFQKRLRLLYLGLTGRW